MKEPFIESCQEMEGLLQEEDLGYLGLCREGRPYVVPLNYSYGEGRILFHCGLEGKKLDFIRSNPEVCFTVARQPGPPRPHPAGETCHVNCDSVLCYGRARILDDMEEREVALNLFNRRFRPQAPELPPERVKNCGVVEIRISQMTGRRERVGPQNRELICWRYTFPPIAGSTSRGGSGCYPKSAL
jgi:hypothetical protein